MLFGKKIRELRDENGVLQRQLAALLEIDISARGVEKQIRKLREAGIIKRVGADRGGYWEITTKEEK